MKEYQLIGRDIQFMQWGPPWTIVDIIDGCLVICCRGTGYTPTLVPNDMSWNFV